MELELVSHIAEFGFLMVYFLRQAEKINKCSGGRTKALRQWRFSSVDEIEPELIKAYIDEAINNQQAGKTIKPAKNKPLILLELLTDVLQEKPKLKGVLSAIQSFKTKRICRLSYSSKKRGNKNQKIGYD